MSNNEAAGGFSESERAAMKQRAEELRSTKGVKGAAKRQREYEACLEALEELEGSDRQVAQRYHVIVSEEAPHLDAKTWYGFPSYALDGEVITFVQPAAKFDTRYATVNFSDGSKLDDGNIWPVSLAVLEITPEIETRLREMVRRAAPKPA